MQRTCSILELPTWGETLIHENPQSFADIKLSHCCSSADRT